MNEVYVLFESWQADSGESGQVCNVYGSLETAMSAFKEAIRTARIDMKYISTEEDYNEDSFEYSIYKAGEYCYNHIDICVYQREIK